MNKVINSKMIDELLKTIPKQNNRCISTYGSQVVDKFKKIPNYDELIKTNNKLQQALNEIEKWVNNYIDSWDFNDEVRKDMADLLEIINKTKGNK